MNLAGNPLGTRRLRLEREGPVLWCVIDRPERKNAMTGAMYYGVRRAIGMVESDPGLAGLIITGVSDVFCVGGDLAGAVEEGDQQPPRELGLGITPYDALRNSSKPVVAAVNGTCMAGGLLMAVLADVAVVSDRAVIRAPDALRGIADMWYAGYVAAHVGVARARDFLLTGRRLSAQEAVDWGLLARLAPHDELRTASREAVLQLASAAPVARMQMKATINEPYGVFYELVMRASMQAEEWREGASAFVEKRAPAWVPPGVTGRL